MVSPARAQHGGQSLETEASCALGASYAASQNRSRRHRRLRVKQKATQAYSMRCVSVHDDVAMIDMRSDATHDVSRKNEFSRQVTHGRFCADVTNYTIGCNVKLDADVKKTTARYPM